MDRTNPFPGMNPYMEQTWPDVHFRIISQILDDLGLELPADLNAKAELQVEILGNSPGRVQPDVAVLEESWKSGLPPVWSPGHASTDIQVSEPVLLQVQETRHRWVEIRSDEGELIAVIEVLSPANKDRHRRAYLAKRSGYVRAGVNVVEIDLLRSGRRTVDVEGTDFDDRFHDLGESYLVCVSRGVAPGRREIYICPLRNRLPVIRIPLRATDPDIPLDIQAMVDRCYETGRYWKLAYDRSPDPPLAESEAEWVRERLRAAGMV